jgi:hypothetical protein
MQSSSLTFSAGASNPRTESAIPKYDGNGYGTPNRPPPGPAGDYIWIGGGFVKCPGPSGSNINRHCIGRGDWFPVKMVGTR